MEMLMFYLSLFWNQKDQPISRKWVPTPNEISKAFCDTPYTIKIEYTDGSSYGCKGG